MFSLELNKHEDVATRSLNSDAVSICIVAPYLPTISETFIRAHIADLPARVTLIHGWRPAVGSKSVMSFTRRVAYKTGRMLARQSADIEITDAYVMAFNRYQAKAVLAEYGTTGTLCMDACDRLGIPLIVHFHGYDASEHSVLEQHKESYPKMFQRASALIVVSHAMQAKLRSLGAPMEKLHYNPYGIDCRHFAGANPATSRPTFLAVGRFVEKKAPLLTLAAFNAVFRAEPDARLRMIGDGPLLEQGRKLATQLGIESAVTFLGAQSHNVVQEEMRRARCFVQHS